MEVTIHPIPPLTNSPIVSFLCDMDVMERFLRMLDPPPADSEKAFASDPRLIEAMERTLLAWVRTGLALMAFGFLVARIGIWLGEIENSEPTGSAAAVWVGTFFVVLGTIANAVAAARFSRSRRALLSGNPVLPGSIAGVAVALSLALMGGILVVYMIF